MKKFWIIFIIILVTAIGVFSTSFGNENEAKKTTYPYNIGTVTAKSLKIRSGLSLENDYIGLLSKGENVHIYRKS